MGRKYLPLLGISPIYWGLVILMTIAACIMCANGLFSVGTVVPVQLLFYMAGLICIILGAVMVIRSIAESKIFRNVQINVLVTTGVYSWVRNPLDAGVGLICTGCILFCHNLFLLILPVFYWFLLAFLMIGTEEKWLLHRYGKDYREYRAKVNRCIPWFPK